MPEEGPEIMAEFLDTFLNIDLLLQIWPMLLRGLWMTLLLAAISVPLAILFGLAAAVLHDLAGPVLRWMVLLVVDLLRAVPPLVLLIFLFYAAPLLGLRLSEMTAAVITLVLNGGAYYAEIFRGGIGTVPRGQREAARSTGLTQLQTMRSVVLPQGTRAVLPDLLSNTLELVKQTSIASAVAMKKLPCAIWAASSTRPRSSPSPSSIWRCSCRSSGWCRDFRTNRRRSIDRRLSSPFRTLGMIRLQNVFYRVADAGRAAEFWRRALDLEPRFADGARWVQFAPDGRNFALADPTEAPAEATGATAVFEVPRIDDHAARIVAAGGQDLGRRDMGSHGRTGTFLDPEGNCFQLFERAG